MIQKTQAVDSVELVHRLRNLGLSPEQFADHCDLSNITIRNYERGLIDNPRRSTVHKINSALDRLERMRTQMETTGR